MSYNFESMNRAGQRTMCKGVNSRELGDIRNLKDFVGCCVLCDGFFFTLFSIGVSAAESAVAIAIILNVYRLFKSDSVEAIDNLKL